MLFKVQIKSHSQLLLEVARSWARVKFP